MMVPGPVKAKVMGGGSRKLKVAAEGEKNTVLDRTECAQKAQTHPRQRPLELISCQGHSVTHFQMKKSFRIELAKYLE